MVFFGEMYGKVQKEFDYGVATTAFRVFDIYDTKTKKYLDFDRMQAIVNELKLDLVPILYRGPWSKDLLELAGGNTTLPGKHIREGFVVKPTVERTSRIGRTILKVIGEEYLLKKGGR
jgi:RNA ligase (TIGR02306 family)